MLILAIHLERIPAMVARGGLTRVARVCSSRSLTCCWIHALIARLHGYLVPTVFVLAARLLSLIIFSLTGINLVAVNLAPASQSACLHSHRMSLVYHGFDRVVLLVCIDERVQLMLICLVLVHLHLVL